MPFSFRILTEPGPKAWLTGGTDDCQSLLARLSDAGGAERARIFSPEEQVPSRWSGASPYGERQSRPSQAFLALVTPRPLASRTQPK
jgi:hypothetical protein